MMRVFLLAVGALSMWGGCATRLARPYVQGTVYDQRTALPLEGVQVRTGEGVEAVTDAKGKFEIQPRTYRELTFPGSEAPPVLLLFWLNKTGYQEMIVDKRSRTGGGDSPQVPWVLERLELKPLN